MDQHGGDGGIDAAREAAEHAALADLRADRGDRLGAKGAHGPIALQAGDLMDEVREQLRAVRRMHDFEMELHGIIAPRLVGDDGDRRMFGGREAAKNPAAVRATASPWLIQTG